MSFLRQILLTYFPMCHDIDPSALTGTSPEGEELLPLQGESKGVRPLGDYSGRVPPLPIPNREVKPASADGTVKTGE